MRNIILFTLIVGLFSCEMDKKQVDTSEIDSVEVLPEVKLKDIPEVKNETPSTQDYEVVAVLTTTGGYGYHIMKDGKLFIKQEIVPSVQGKRTFKTEKDALLVGEFVANKLRKGIMPPSVTPSEMEELEVELK